MSSNAGRLYADPNAGMSARSALTPGRLEDLQKEIEEEIRRAFQRLLASTVGEEPYLAQKRVRMSQVLGNLGGTNEEKIAQFERIWEWCQEQAREQEKRTSSIAKS